MNNNNKMYRRYLLFLCAVFINAFGIAAITKATLGTSPITSLTYVLSMFTPLSMGEWTTIVNLGFVVIETTMMTRAEIKADLRMFLLQIPISLCFGWFIDVSMNILYWMEPVNYIVKIVTLVVSCCILAFGISLEVKADVAMMSGEYMVRVISRFVKIEFGYVKLMFDITLVILACVLSLVFLSGIYGVREGTVIAALIVGPVVHFLKPYLAVLDGWLYGTSAVKEANVQPVVVGRMPVVITIAREFGSGGHQLGEMIARKLNIKFYDKEIIKMTAKESNLSEEYISENEQSMPSNGLMKFILTDVSVPLEKSLSSADALFVSESRVIRQLASEQSCVIIGRCSDYILDDHPIIKVFCYTDAEDACRRCVKEYNIGQDVVEAERTKINRARMNHYQHYTGRRWGDPHNYDIMINTGRMDLSVACDLISGLYRHLREQEKSAAK